MQVRLKKALLKYHPSLVMGAVGESIGVHGKHSRESPKIFVGVRFEQHTLDVMWTDLEILREAPRPKVGPQVELTQDKPPKRGQEVSLGPLTFKVESIETQVDDTTWVVNVIPA